MPEGDSARRPRRKADSDVWLIDSAPGAEHDQLASGGGYRSGYEDESAEESAIGFVDARPDADDEVDPSLEESGVGLLDARPEDPDDEPDGPVAGPDSDPELDLLDAAPGSDSGRLAEQPPGVGGGPAGGRPSTGRGRRPTGREPRPAADRGPRSTSRSPRPATGRTPRPATGRTPRSATGRTPRPATGRRPRPTGRTPRPATGRAPRPDTGQAPRPTTGQTPRPATGRTPRPATGRRPRPVTGRAPRPEEAAADGEAPAIRVREKPRARRAAPGPTTVGYAVCPACEARNQAEAPSCGRCGEPIPAAGPPPDATAVPGAAIKVAARRPSEPDGEEAPADPEAAGPDGLDDDLFLPPTVRAELEARAAADEARGQAARERRRRRSARYVAAGAGILLGTGLPVSFLGLGLGLGFLAGVLDLALGAAGAALLLRTEGGTVPGQLRFGLAAAASVAAKIALAGVAYDVSLVFLFVAGVVQLLGVTIAGGLFGRLIEDQPFDDGY